MSADQTRALGLGAIYKRDGKTYTVSPWTFGIQARYSLHLRYAALESIREMEREGLLTPDEAKEQKAQVHKDAAAGVYVFGSPFVMESIYRSKANLSQLFWLQVSHTDRNFTLAQATALVDQDAEGVIEAISEANAAPGGEDPDPNSQAPDSPGSQ